MQTSVKYIKKIKAMTRAMNMDRQTYLAALLPFGVESCKALGDRKAGEFIAKLEPQAIKMGVWESTSGKRKKALPYAEYEGREWPSATPKQLRMLAGMWKDVSRAKTEKERKTALDKFTKRITGVDKFDWIEHKHVAMMKKAMDEMLKTQNERKSV